MYCNARGEHYTIVSLETFYSRLRLCDNEGVYEAAKTRHQAPFEIFRHPPVIDGMV
jgi:hypothetical protein